MIPLEGTVPYPSTADPTALDQAAAAYTQLATRLQAAASDITEAVTAAKGGWTGSAAGAWAAHLTNRASLITSLAGTVGRVPPALSAMAAAIGSTSASYTNAAISEQAARNGLPWTAAALAAALGEETAVAASLQAAGVRCAASLAGVLTSLLADVAALGLHEIESDLSGIGAGLVHAAVAGLNGSTSQIALGGGTQLRVNPVGVAVASTPALVAVEAALGGTIRMLESKLHLTADDGSLLTSLQSKGLVTQPTNVAQVFNNEALLEATRRAAGDKSALILNTIGTNPDGTSNLSVTVGGINPTGSLMDDTGGRSPLDSGADQLTKWGREEQGVYDDVVAQGVQPGDTVNLYGHSQGGIVMQNVANQLSAQGYNVNVITDGSPETQLAPGVNAQVFQDQSDLVPATRNFGTSGPGVVQFPGQQVVTSDSGLDPLTAHNPDSYGAWATANPTAPGVQAANGQLGSLGDLTGVRSNITVLSGSTAPAGTPVTVPAPPTVNLAPTR